jgi:hypothetical protein
LSALALRLGTVRYAEELHALLIVSGAMRLLMI